MTGIWVIAGTAGLLAGGICLFKLCRRERETRLESLWNAGVTITVEEALADHSIRRLVQISFGYGQEIWALYDDDAAIDTVARILKKAKLVVIDKRHKAVRAQLGSMAQNIDRWGYRL